MDLHNINTNEMGIPGLIIFSMNIIFAAIFPTNFGGWVLALNGIAGISYYLLKIYFDYKNHKNNKQQ